MDYVVKDNQVLIDKDPFNSVEAGSAKESFFLKGLTYKITVKASGTVRSIYLYTSDVPEDETNRFSFTDEGGGIYTYEEESGTGSTALSIATESGANFEDGIGFYFRIKIQGSIGATYINRRFWIRDPQDFIKIQGRLGYKSPYPVLVGSRTLSVEVGFNAKNDAGSS